MRGTQRKRWTPYVSSVLCSFVCSLCGARGGIGLACAADGRGRQPRPGTPAGPPIMLAPAVPSQQREEDDQYDFLIGSVIDAAALQHAGAEAARSGVTTHQALLAMGLVSAPAYASALARTLGVTLA